MPNVYIVNRSGHDFTPALSWGDLVYLSEGHMRRYDINAMYRQFVSILKNSKSDDFIVPAGLANMSIIAAAIFARMHGRVNLLLYKGEEYIQRSVVVDSLLVEDNITGDYIDLIKKTVNDTI